MKNVRSLTLMTHFATADGAPGVAEQWRASLPRPAAWRNGRASPTRPRSCATPERTATGCAPASCSTAPRRLPIPPAARSACRPAMTLASEIIAMQAARARRDAWAMAARSAPSKPMRIGVVACGYADGYPRHAPTGTPVMVDGVRTRTVGRVSMDMLMRGPRRGPAGARRLAGGTVGRGICRSTKWRVPPARSATNSCARWRRACRSSED